MTSSIADDVLGNLGIELGDELRHYGKKGMKWGVVRARGANGRVSGTVSEDHTSTQALKSKKQKEMSNSELKKVNERLQLERKNKELQNRGVVEKIKLGTAIAGTILAVGVTVNSAMSFANSPAGKAIKSALDKNPADPNWLF